MLNLNIDLETGAKVAVGGYAKGCGKTQLAMYIAEQVSSDLTVCLVTQSDRMETSVYESVISSLKRPHDFDIVGETPVANYDVVIYDYFPSDVTLTNVFYITRTPLEDVDLGIIDHQMVEFKRKIYNAIFEKYAAVPVFIDETFVSLKTDRHRDLDATDWVVIRELEKMFLQGTEIGNARKFLREVKNKYPSQFHTF